MLDEKKFVLAAFSENFGAYRGKPLVIYGLGKNTKAVVDHFSDYNIVGLMDEIRTGDIVFGKPVITIEEASAMGAAAVIIIARAANVSIIYRRISDFCAKEKIPVYDILGNEQTLTDEDATYHLPERYQALSYDDVKGRIDKADVVSFDIFDTLLGRKTLYPRDVFYLMEHGLVLRYGNAYKGFAAERISTEQKLYEHGQTTLTEIYETLLAGKSYPASLNAADYVHLELEWERKVLMPRAKTNELLQYARNAGKETYLTSDMYIEKNDLLELLCEKGIAIEPDHLFVSNDKGAAKHDGLFQALRKACSFRSILHIGDSQQADVDSALHAGIEDACLLPNALSMLEDSKCGFLLQSGADKLLWSRYMIGSFAAHFFEDPFLFGATKGKPVLSNEFEMGKYLIAPLAYVLSCWMLTEAARDGIDHILLSARDGYLLNMVFDKIKEHGVMKNMPEYSYFYASRKVCVMAGLYTPKDISCAAQLAFAGSPEELLQKRFGLKKEELLERGQDEDLVAYVLRHEKTILRYAEKVRQSYMAYIDKQGYAADKKYGFFDFVSSGSCQLGLSAMTKWDITGYYVNRFYDERKDKRSLQIKTLYPIRVVYDNQDAIMGTYMFLENVFTSFEPTLDGFDKEGTPLFMKEARDLLQFDSLEQIQHGILEGCLDYIKMGIDVTGMPASLYQFPDQFLKLLKGHYMEMKQNAFKENLLLDEFCNRVFEL